MAKKKKAKALTFEQEVVAQARSAGAPKWEIDRRRRLCNEPPPLTLAQAKRRAAGELK